MGTILKEEAEYRGFCIQQNLDKAVHTLLGLLDGIALDGVINDQEQAEISNWIQVQDEFSDMLPFSEIISRLHNALDDGVLSMDEVEDLRWVCNNYLSKEGPYNDITHGMQILQGIIHGIMADGEITMEELDSLTEWMEENEYLRGYYPYDEIESILAQVMTDRKISQEESELLQAFLGEFVDTSLSINISDTDLNSIREKHTLEGLCAVCPQIDIKDHLFCFTGKSSKASRKEIADAVVQHGGKFNNQVVSGTQYLVVGNDNSSCWAYCSYGRKVEKAMKMRNQGAHIVIIHENDFWDAIAEQ